MKISHIKEHVANTRISTMQDPQSTLPSTILICLYILPVLIFIVTLSMMLSSFHHRCNLRGTEPYTMKLLGVSGNAVNALVVRSVLRLFSCYSSAMRLDARSRMRVQERNPPSCEITAFLGDSTFNYWFSLAENVPQSFNAAFGGSRSIDVLRFIDKVCLRWLPKIVVLHVGGNDWDLGDTTRTYGNIVKIIQKIRCGGARAIIFFTPRAPLYSDAKWKFMSKLRDRIKANKVCGYIDMASGTLANSAYMSDGVHFAPSGYKKIAEVIANRIIKDEVSLLTD